MIGTSDACIGAFKPNGKKFWSSYFGGDKGDDLQRIDCDGKNLYLGGYTTSVSGLATKGSFLDTNTNSGGHGLILKIGEAQIGYTSDTLDPVSISNEITQFNFLSKLYPNPNSGNFIFETRTDTKYVTLSIIDITGKIIWTKEVATSLNGQIKEDIKLENLSVGVYFMLCNGDGKNEIIEFVKKYSKISQF